MTLLKEVSDVLNAQEQMNLANFAASRLSQLNRKEAMTSEQVVREKKMHNSSLAKMQANVAVSSIIHASGVQFPDGDSGRYYTSDDAFNKKTGGIGFRILGIDSLEGDSPMAVQAKLAIAERVKGKEVFFKSDGSFDSHGRSLVEMWLSTLTVI